MRRPRLEARLQAQSALPVQDNAVDLLGVIAPRAAGVPLDELLERACRGAASWF